MSTYILTDDDGAPEGVVDMTAITDAGTELAFALAANCNDQDAVQRISAATLARVGTKSFGYVAANALHVLVTEVLNPVLDVTDALGQNLRAGLTAISEGRDPGAT